MTHRPGLFQVVIEVWSQEWVAEFVEGDQAETGLVQINISVEHKIMLKQAKQTFK